MPESACLDAHEWFALRRLHHPSERTRVRARRLLHRILLRRSINDAEQSFGACSDFK